MSKKKTKKKEEEEVLGIRSFIEALVGQAKKELAQDLKKEKKAKKKTRRSA